MIKTQTNITNENKIEKIYLKLEDSTAGVFANSRNQALEWNVKPSKLAINTINPIRAIVEHLKVQPNPSKQFIPLSVGDPTIFGNLKTANETIDAVRNAINECKHNGYAHSAGSVRAREAVCKYVAPHLGTLTADDVILCSGCSSALDMHITVLADRGQNILVPRPGFSIYRTLATSHDIEVRSYNLLPNKQW